MPVAGSDVCDHRSYTCLKSAAMFVQKVEVGDVLEYIA